MRKILVKGPCITQSGYGAQARYALRALRKYPEFFDIYLINTTWGKCGWQWEDNEERQWIDSLLQKTMIYNQQGGQFDTSLQVLTPIEWKPMAPENIGYTAGIETTKIAPQWINPSEGMDRIIVTSNHAKHGMVNTSYPAKNNIGQDIVAKISTPIHVVNYCQRQYEQDPNFEIDFPCDFNFLVVVQWSPRKNVEQTIRGFVEEFIDKEVGLVLKISTVCNALMDRDLTTSRIKNLLKEYPDRKCKVHLLHGDLSDGEMASLYNHPKIKALISLSHGEGFGLPPFEAVCNGLPIISPAWSGICDFIHMKQRIKKNKKVKEQTVPMISAVEYDMKPVQPEAHWDGFIVPDASWCFPKDFRYKFRMREAIKKYDELKSRARKLQEHVLEEFSEEKMYKKFAEAVLGTSIEEARNNYNVVDIGSLLQEDTPMNDVMEYKI